jgi:hypothetical protein
MMIYRIEAGDIIWSGPTALQSEDVVENGEDFSLQERMGVEAASQRADEERNSMASDQGHLDPGCAEK